jgi:hypothetical protein
MEWFKIEWQGAYPIETAQSKIEAMGYGIYAIFGVKNKETKLLYIGETYRQTFGKRLRQHKKEWLFRVNDKMVIHFGKVELPQGVHITQNKIFDIEGVLIHVLLPPFNNISKHGYSGREIVVFNFGKRAILPPFVGNRNFVNLLHEVIKNEKRAI